MKRSLFAFMLLASVSTLFAQTDNPVSWTFSAKKIKADTYEIHLTATIEKEWHIYSQTTPEGGPIPTSISFTRNPLLVFNGAAKEVGKLEQRNEPLFGVDVKQFSNKVDFVQLVKIKGSGKTSVTGSVEYMSCNETSCLPPATMKFSVALK